jgi:hypothetical protein
MGAGWLAAAKKSYLLLLSLSIGIVLTIPGPVVGGAGASAQEATPMAYDAPFDPIDLYEALLFAEFPTEYFPTGATAAATSPWIDPGDGTLEGSIAAVQISFENATGIALAYAIYPTVEAAEEAFARAEAGAGGLATPIAAGTLDGEPAIGLDYGDYQVYLVQVNNVLIDGAAVDPAWADVIATYGVKHLRRVVATLPPASATPVASDSAFGQITPEELNERLLAAEFSGAGVPSHLLNPQVAEWSDESDTDLVGTVGAATVTFTGGDNGIAYIIFPSSDHAERRVIDTTGLERARGVEVTERTDLAYPAVITNDGEEVVCVLQVDFALVAAHAVIENDDPDAAIAQAIALAEAGADHMVKLAKTT